MAPRKAAAKKGNVYKLGAVVAPGLVLNDSASKRSWTLGADFAAGGCGRIYYAKETTPGCSKKEFVVKMEAAENGPLFLESHVYQRVAKADMLDKWKKTNKVSFLGVATYEGSGTVEQAGARHRFLVLPRFGADLESVRERQRTLDAATALGVSLHCVDALRYLHELRYVHADVKAENLLAATANNADPTRFVLVDFGLARKVPQVPVYKEMPKKAHDGTLIFTSLDAHRGCAPSYRGDVEILAYNLIYWLSGSLPWSKAGDNPTKVFEAKQHFSKNVAAEVGKILPSCSFVGELVQLFEYVYGLDYANRPDHKFLTGCLTRAIDNAQAADTPLLRRRSSSRLSRRVDAASPLRELVVEVESVAPPARQKSAATSSKATDAPVAKKRRAPAAAAKAKSTVVTRRESLSRIPGVKNMGVAGAAVRKKPLSTASKSKSTARTASTRSKTDCALPSTTTNDSTQTSPHLWQ